MKGTVVPGPGEPAKLSAAQQGHVEAFWRLTVATASERSWHMLHHTYTFPEGFAGLISVNEQESLQCMARIRETAELILAAEEASRDPEHNDRVVPRHGMELLQLCPSLIAAAQIFPSDASATAPRHWLVSCATFGGIGYLWSGWCGASCGPTAGPEAACGHSSTSSSPMDLCTPRQPKRTCCSICST